MDESQRDKFKWHEGDIVSTPSQCAYCLNNEDVHECAVFGVEPSEYRSNEETCLRRKPQEL
jgi:hypothetical protein